jgi:adenosylhomocysteine nucleosidase
MIIGIISAMQNEFELIVDALENKEIKNICNIDFYTGTINNHKIIGVISGIGKVNSAITAALLINNFNPDLVINSGIAGGTVGLNPRDIIIPEKLAYSDVDVRAFEYEFGQIPGMPLYYETDKNWRKLLEQTLTALEINYKNSIVLTADTFRSTSKNIENNINLGYAVEMEGASIAQACYKLNIPFISIRFISDILDTENHIDDYNSFEKEASNLSGIITIKFINKI